jgi:hypothetical protein
MTACPKSFRLLRLVVLGVLLSQIGCLKVGFDPTQFDAAIEQLDRSITVLDSAVGESKEWRKSLPSLAKQLEDSGALMADKVRDLSAYFAEDLSGATKEAIDFIEVKIKDNLVAFRTALAKARAEVIDAKGKRDQAGISKALDQLAKVKVYHDPVVTKFIPSKINLVWNDHARESGYTLRERSIYLSGWGFERPKGEKGRFKIMITGVDGDSRPVPISILGTTTRYEMQIKLDSKDDLFKPGDQWLRFYPDGEFEQSLPIHEDTPALPSANPEPETIAQTKVLVQTTGDNKEPRGQVTMWLYADDSVLFHCKLPFGAGQEWKNGGAYDPYLQGWEAVDPAIAIKKNRHIQLRVELATVEVGREVSWKSAFRVSLKTTRGRILDFQSESHEFDTNNETRFATFSFDLPEEAQ